MYGKPDINCFKYQVFLYGSEAITYLNAILWVVTEPAVLFITLPPPPPPLQASLPHFVWQHYLLPFERELLYGLNYHSYFKKQRGETQKVQESSHAKQLSPKPRV